MAAGRKRKSRESTQKRKASLAAKRGWETRRANERARARAARAAQKKRAATLARKRARHEARVLAARKGWATKRARREASLALKALRDATVEARRRYDAGLLEEGGGEELIAPFRETWHDAKAGLYEALEEDFGDYIDLLDDLADEVDVDWNISYGPEEAA